MKKALLISLALVAATVGCSSQKHETAVPETVTGIQLYKTAMTRVPDAVMAVGTVRAAETAQIAAQVMGNVTAVSVREGDPVRAGQVLVSIDPAQAQASLERAQAALSAAQHEQAAAQTERALTEATLKRYETLYQRKSVSPQEYDEIKARYQGSLARAEAAQAGQAQAKAAVAQAQTGFGYTKLRAPFDGVVTSRMMDPGMLATPGSPIVTVEATGRYRLEATVDEGSLRFVKIGETVPVRLDAYPDEQLAGKVTQIVPSADPASRTFMVKVELPANRLLRSGLFGRASLARGERDSLVLPKTAVVDRGALKGVFVVGPDQIATLRYVTVGDTRDDGFEVLSGLGPNESVVLSPGDREIGGKRVEVR
ncbi:MAG TPA: efflux RND transporter periplasmic adaptor subunit [Terriglobales bacterium]|nr:efflux RND transporter periplasmic adaptor subunit [Terriglobales bacterium]